MANAQLAPPGGAHHAGMAERRPDSTTPDPTIAAGTIEAQVVDAAERPIANRRVRLGIMRQSVAEGNDQSERFATTDAEGRVRFSNLERSSQFAYRVTVAEGAATYTSPPFNLKEDAGFRVLLHIYPVTRDVEQTSVGIRGIVYVQPRDDVFQIEMMFRVMNVGQLTWVPENVIVELPPGSKGFGSSEQTGSARVVKVDEQQVRLEGTFRPGQEDVSFRFQIPNESESVARFGINLLPHMADVRVMTESAPGMRLEVDGFGPAEPATNQKGERILVTARQVRSLSDPPMTRVAVTLSGIPTPGVGRWVAVLLAACAVAAGLFAVARRGAGRTRPQALTDQEVGKAREVLLDELVALERAKTAGDVGPTTYEAARQGLFDALLRLEERQNSVAQPS
jgi:hypothetical protein